MAARELLQADGIAARVVSTPCWELFERQDAAYRAAVIGDAPVRIAVEAGGAAGLGAVHRRGRRCSSA